VHGVHDNSKETQVKIKTLLLGSIALASTLGGCAAIGDDGDDVDTMEDAHTVKPVGTEKMGYLAFEEPEWPAGATPLSYEVKYGERKMKPGEPLRVKTGRSKTHAAATTFVMCARRRGGRRRPQ
jgi:hypothetical protein